jgi:DNA repair exonuclease SbcCD ATPase subunit
MGFKCAHFADIHFRGLSRHEEYREVFSNIFKKISKMNLDAIFIGGDIVHSKTQGISPELIDVLVWWFKGLADIAPVHVILGNHDGLILNKDRQDAITPIIQAIGDDRIFLYKDSDSYTLESHDVSWCVFSCFDEESWSRVKPVPNTTNIALFHGPVQGSKVDSDWEIDEPNQINVDFFKEFDFTFLGDIHKSQFLDEENRIAYCGSTIQQNYGEDVEKGFLVWDIESKEDFKVKFYPVKNRFSFYTIPWEGNVEDTLKNISESMEHGRFRIRSNTIIPQSEIKQLSNGLKETYKATEVVFKWDVEDTKDDKINIGDTTLDKEDLLNPATHVKLMSNYTKTFPLSNEEREMLEGLTKRVASEAARGEYRKNLKWSLKKLKFNNTFGYGNGNIINFEKMNGITGIFGKNRTGKSSIPGTIMYSLFNSTDRGAIKNIHIINSRKGFCNIELDISVNGKPYKVERQSAKHTSRAGKTSASTSLNLWKTDSEGNKVEDLSGEQRRETEKDLKNLVGTSDDFLLTSLASQGSMNNFIKNGATIRKSILTKFLDLGIFDNMLNIAKNEFSELKGSMKSAPDRDWASIIRNKRLELESITSDRDETEEQCRKVREETDSMKLMLATHENSEAFTEEEIEDQDKLIVKLKSRSNLMKSKIIDISDEIIEIENKLQKISAIKEQFPIQELKEKLNQQKEIEGSLQNIEHLLEKEKTLLKSQRKSASTLKVVPCGDSFPTCKFIKDSHLSKKKIPSQEEKVKEISENCSAVKRNLKKILGESLNDKIKKYEDILKSGSDLKLERGNILVSLTELEVEDSNISQNLLEEKNKLSKMKLNATAASEAKEVSRLKKTLKTLSERSNFLDAEKLRLSEKIGLFQQQLSDSEEEKEKFANLKKQWNAYNAFLQSVDKKGIPLRIMSVQLPLINSEIEKILHGVVEFTIEIEADDSTNALDVFINYGDSKRVIECASGMEKMLSSLAIRVALINVSNLPKSDLLIIDEGFGTLDEGNIETCNRLLVSLKRWFRHIFVISHIDAIKDVVDNVLDIRSKGKNSLVVHE